ncbi:MAG: hypothetical protein HOP28_05275 [Gemmatimonadales bacterium]|nr:hypothetical protein [Gemmatimonadales bacterium]
MIASSTSGQSVRETPYRAHAALTQNLQSLAGANGPRAQLVTVATSPGGRAIQALRIGAGADAASRPALLVVANASGPHIVGSEIALVTAERLLSGYGKDSTITRLLDQRTIWFIPRLNPDAAEALFRGPRQERTANDAPWDDDRDQATNEDGPDDLNADGVITMLRIEDPTGEWMVDPTDPSLLRRADPAKGERGKYILVREGKDDDGDERLNEDGLGGTDINKNFTFSHPHLGAEAGMHPFSSPEARGLVEFVMAHPEIAAVYVIGPQDNTARPWTFRAGTGIAGAATGTSAGGPLQSIARPDEPTYADFSRRFLRTTGVTRTPTDVPNGGDVLSWFYYDFGRWSIGSRGWWVPEAPRDTSAAGRTAGGGGAPGGGAAGAGADLIADERNAFRWARARQPDAFVPWTKVTIPGETRNLEVGGWKPGALLNPPAGGELDSTLARQQRFIAELAGLLPKVAMAEPTVETIGAGVYRITADLVNQGGMPTTSSIGQRLGNPRRIRLELTVGSHTMLSGRKVELIGPLAAGGSLRRTWTVVAPAGTSITLKAESPTTGSVTRTITLR